MSSEIGNRLLRWGFCAVWVFALFMAFEEFLASWAADSVQEQMHYEWFTVVSLGVFLAGILAHAYLSPKKDSDA